ncbi:MAG: hypothetical protein IJ874_05775 [Ruminococcus sp.]|nr:hypothetical protein [Ruminococcus sp.]
MNQIDFYVLLSICVICFLIWGALHIGNEKKYHQEIETYINAGYTLYDKGERKEIGDNPVFHIGMCFESNTTVKQYGSHVFTINHELKEINILH